jgi:hypothetical protein
MKKSGILFITGMLTFVWLLFNCAATSFSPQVKGSYTPHNPNKIPALAVFPEDERSTMDKELVTILTRALQGKGFAIVEKETLEVERKKIKLFNGQEFALQAGKVLNIDAFIFVKCTGEIPVIDNAEVQILDIAANKITGSFSVDGLAAETSEDGSPRKSEDYYPFLNEIAKSMADEIARPYEELLKSRSKVKK